uniref:Uncharacterized protein n=1 Tax=Oryza barthii TaxID=65489 RepID=A0A0D3EU64_9ORYZ
MWVWLTTPATAPAPRTGYRSARVVPRLFQVRLCASPRALTPVQPVRHQPENQRDPRNVRLGVRCVAWRSQGVPAAFKFEITGAVASWEAAATDACSEDRDQGRPGTDRATSAGCRLASSRPEHAEIQVRDLR